MKQLTGQDVREMFAASTQWLEKSAADIDAINVFPVPDGDTGTNMLLTMRSAIEEAYQSPDLSVSSVLKGMANGAFMGARGNSGIILSQIFRGLARGLEGKDSLTGQDLAKALAEAASTAYQGLSRPVEGTILTVIRDVAKAAERVVKERFEDLIGVLEASVNAAKESVARTPLLLPILKEAGVVDAGGQGLYVILEGVLRYLKDEAKEAPFRKPQIVAPALTLTPKIITISQEEGMPYGYCTEFIIKGKNLNLHKIRKRLETKGQSLMVIGDATNVRVHIHTRDPGSVLRYATSLGTLHQISIKNMDDQHKQFLEMQKQRVPLMDIAVIAVVTGEGIEEVFRSLGVAAIVPGGQTMNPSVRELLQAVEMVPSDKIIVLPNNKNVILTASQVQSLTSKKVVVVPTKTVPQGVSALLAFSYLADLEENVRVMEEAIQRVKTIGITQAVRTAQLKGLSIKKGQIIAIVDDEELVAAGDNIEKVIFEAISKTGIDEFEVVTIYWGAGTKAEEAEKLAQEITTKYPRKQIELVYGGQPHYNYIISLE